MRRLLMRNSPNAAAVLGRVALALIFVLSGAGKLADQEATLGYIVSSGLPFPVVALWGAIAMELVGGLALAAGFHARLAALALAGFSLVAALLFHAELSDQNQMVHFLKNIAIAGGMLQVAAFGAGSVSIDGLLARRGAAVVKS
jgi:putative oxidoreductase